MVESIVLSTPLSERAERCLQITLPKHRGMDTLSTPSKSTYRLDYISEAQLTGKVVLPDQPPHMPDPSLYMHLGITCD